MAAISARRARRAAGSGRGARDAGELRLHEGEPAREGGRATVEDEDFLRDGRETIYYVRAIQEPSLAVNGAPLRCERDEAGSCVRSRPCQRGPDGWPDDCLAEVEERAWSSPIFLDVFAER